MSSFWASDIETEIFTIVKIRALNQLRERYTDSFSDLNFTMDNTQNIKPIFPMIYLHFQPSSEIGQDLDGTTINGIKCTVDCEITVNEEDGMSFARFISGVMVGEFKKLRFRVNSLPEFKGDSPDTKRQIFRATRIIGASDTLA